MAKKESQKTKTVVGKNNPRIVSAVTEQSAKQKIMNKNVESQRFKRNFEKEITLDKI